MTYQLPQLLPHCQVSAQHFCLLCRDRDRGRAFRFGVLERQGIKSVEIDFECPKGKPWKSRGLGDTIAKLTSKVGIKPCGGCAKRKAALNNIIPYKK